MNYLVPNLKFLIGTRANGQSEHSVAVLAGANQSTLNRILSGGTPEPRDSTLVPLAKLFGVSVQDLRYKDLRKEMGGEASIDSVGLPGKRDVSLILPSQDFPVPATVRNSPIPTMGGIEVATSWLGLHTTSPAAAIRYAINPDDAMRGEVEKGDVVFFDTTVKQVDGDGIYAFTYFGTPQIRHGRVTGKNSLVFSGTRNYANEQPVEGEEMEGLLVHGLVLACWSFKTF